MSHELKVTCFIAAPPEKVWDVLTNRMEEWWCPKPWRVEVDHQDRRAGGRCAMTMYGPNGEVMPNEGIFLAWEEGRRFVTTDAFTAEDFDPAGPFMVGFWEIEPEGDGTRYTARAKHWSEEARRKHEEMGFTQGWSAVAEQLKELCETD
ncbi:ATPase [Erythrobacter sp. SG61-1L]|uniref:SRPBCC family protein n=1 Tax=Erythrobacter sp. SG61-1L TaxID=1603897 RepID=UPI0006C93828|nr:SRPBCC family protein [Erythrobacter sp. SG61-1L]KPL67030.1 ATPase [Erythrobacter sp. SG61-1L]